MEREKGDYTEHEALPVEPYDFSRSQPHERYEEEHGTMESDPERNRRIMAFFERQKVIGSCERGHLDSRIIALAAKVALTINPTENQNDRTLRRKLSVLRQLGWTLSPYSGLKGGRLRGYVSTVCSEIKAAARAQCPAVLTEISQRNKDLVNQIYHRD